MPYHEPEPDDPHVLVGVGVPADRESIREMAVAFAEEFARLGFARARLLALFRTPFYAGAHQALVALGEAEIARIVDDALRVWGGCRTVIVDGEGARCQK